MGTKSKSTQKSAKTASSKAVSDEKNTKRAAASVAASKTSGKKPEEKAPKAAKSAKTADKATKPQEKPSKAPAKKTAVVAGSVAKTSEKASKDAQKPTSSTKAAPKTTKTTKPVKPAKVRRASRRKRPIGLIVAVCGIVAILAGLIIIPNVIKLTPQEEPETTQEEPEPEEQPEEEPQEEEKPEEEEKPAPVSTTGNTSGYSGGCAANMPCYISIPSLGLNNIRVVTIGKVGNAMGTPSSDYVVGWYNESVLPGQNGASVMTAHGGDLGTGIFKTLPRIKNGAKITVTMGSGVQYTFTVMETATKAAGAEANAYMPYMFRTAVTGVPGLNLITCTGNWIRSQQAYDKRFFVRAIMQG